MNNETGNFYGVQNTCKAIKNKLLSYINTEYFGKCDALRAACADELRKVGVLYQEPYIEANNAYMIVENGLYTADIDEDVKKFLHLMIERNLGVFKNPYKHQIEALEAYFKGKDLFISTGTGSGKTECFMWPIVSKLVLEQMRSPKTWEIRGIRAIMLYPMNALVADQMGRLRHMIGNEGGFHDVVSELVPGARIPQFGMYTGRTPYPGKFNKKKNEEFANTLEEHIINKDDYTKEKLIELGKYPSKKDLKVFIEYLRSGSSKLTTDPSDSELITRQEMQRNCPDILISNYSMLEYMLMRPIEKSLWENTRKWLSSNSQNKLLFVIDEAHMYHGASGAEVALLIRRVLNKLEISRDRVQFILTSASVPDKCEEDVSNFACDLSSQSRSKETFVIIKGTKASLADKGSEFEPEVLKDFNIDAFQGNWSEKSQAIREFGRLVGFSLPCNFDDEVEVGNWLYKQLKDYGPMLRILKETRGQATSLKKLPNIAFPNCKNYDWAENAVNVLLAIAPLAKDLNGNMLYPARLHLMFRGLQGVYACLNRNCNCDCHKASSLNLGHIYIEKPGNRCTCGGLIYELVNERTCGALFIRGYVKPEQFSEDCFVWNEPNQDLLETHFYIVDESYRRDEKHKFAWLNSMTGKLDTDDPTGSDGFVQVVYTNESSSKAANGLTVNTFKKCPKCGKANFHATDFSTKGNEPFYNLVSEQFRIQPPVQKYIDQTNQGRKVLLFSDSRQRAALLAKDLTEAADEEAMRKALTMAVNELQNWAKVRDEQPKLNYLYWAFVKIAYEHKLNFFYGEDAKWLERDIETISNKKTIKYNKLSEDSSRPQKYDEHLLRQLCSNFRSLTDAGLCWIEPYIDEDEEEAIEIEKELLKNKIFISIDEFKQMFASWAMKVMVSYYALDANIRDTSRKHIATYSGHRFGLAEDEIMPSSMEKLLKEIKNLVDDKQIEAICKILKKYLKPQQGRNNRYYLNINKLIICFDEKHDWYKCPRCSSIFPYTLWGKCAHCMQGEPKLMSKADLEGISFWRDPALEAIDKPSTIITRINTEEHTAQLSHKEQRQEVWSTTEDFEMRFQNVSVDDKHPVDVLSCTTTMEVGIDIGSLVAIGLRNIPPMRENYQQRAGRAGRRGAAISTIVTYADNKPHDSYYFHNPGKIISGEPRVPWIDVGNEKLIYRHLNVTFTTNFFGKSALSVDEIKLDEFIQNYYDKFIDSIKNLAIEGFNGDILIPEYLQFDFGKYKEKFAEQLEKLKDKFKKFPAQYYDNDSDKKKIKSLLDAFLECGIFPTYSFARNIVGFYVESSDGKKIEQKPQRSLEIAISEYAPGRLVVINKEVYKSGGIYNFYSKFSQDGNHPARNFFNNTEYFKENLYCCSEPRCNWMGFPEDTQELKTCPFCGATKLNKQNMLKPWGFAPLNGKASDEANPEFEITYAEEPCYSYIPEKEQLKSLGEFEHLLYCKRGGDSIIILNKGTDTSGFTVCKDCGAAVPGNKKIEDYVGIPYCDYKNRNCKHSSQTNTYLGDQFVTDMILYVIELDNCKVSKSLWMRRAGRTLAEAMALAGGRLLDIEFTEIRSGYRIRSSQDVTYLDVFLFDSLSSGAGYCSELVNRNDDFIRVTKEILDSCPNNCDSACYGCLKHYWNQQNHYMLDRHAALDLLNWAEKSELPKNLSYDEQAKLLAPINYLEALKINGDGFKHYIRYNGMKIEIVVYPDMRIEFNSENKIFISDKELKYDFPNAYNKIKQSVVERIHTI